MADIERTHAGLAFARAHEADRNGRPLLPGALVANSLNELRAMLPTEVTRTNQTSASPPDVIETRD